MASGASNDTNNHALQHYFGSVDPQYSKMLAEDKFAHETYNLPKAYEGKNKYLEKVIDYLVTNENDWYTSEVLPWVETDDLSIKWEIFRFNKTLMDLEPHQGVPRYVTAEREARSDRLVRRGLAFIIEHGFYSTDQGRQHYLMNLRQIVDSVNETAYHGVVHALLTCDNHYKEWNRQHGARVSRPGDLQRHQKRLWGIVQKQERGLYLLDAELKDVMRYEGVTPDTWIVPSKMSIYVTMVPSSEVEYYRGGPNTQDSMERGPAKMLTFRGSKVFESRPFDIDFIGEPYDLLVRRRQIGEYFIMGGRASGKAADGTPETNDVAAAAGKYDSFIFDMDVDNFVKISFEEAALAGLRSICNNPSTDAQAIRDAINLGPGPNMDNISDAAASYTTLMSGNATGGKPPFRVLLVRPFETYDMASAILLKRGLETGMTAHGHHDFMLSDDVIHKVHIGHYTFYHASVVKQPKNITIAEDIFARNYVSGEGTQLYSDALEFTGDQQNDRFNKDLIAMIIPAEAIDSAAYSEEDKLTDGSNKERPSRVTNPLDLSGAFEGYVLDAVPTDLQDRGDALYPLSARYNNLMAFSQIKNYGDGESRFINPLRQNNSICWQGMQLEYRNTSEGGKFDVITLATGHWGPNVYSGCKSVRTGENAFLKDMEYEKVRTSQGVVA